MATTPEPSPVAREILQRVRTLRQIIDDYQQRLIDAGMMPPPPKETK